MSISTNVSKSIIQRQKDISMKHLFTVQNVRKILMHFLRMELRYKHTQKKKNEITIHTHTKNRNKKNEKSIPQR